VLAACARTPALPPQETGAGTVSHGQSPLLETIDSGLTRAGRFLVAKQSPDGAWRSEKYGCFRGGLELGGLVLSSLYFMPQAGPEAKTSYRRGVAYLAAAVSPGGELRSAPLEFPVYTSSMASRMVALLDRTPENLAAQQGWLKVLLSHQLDEKLGWQPQDPEYGGWGFAIHPPRKPPSGEMRAPFVESNLTSTVFGIAALRSAKLPDDHPALRAALVFVERCQNFAANPAEADATFDDGGFFFMPGRDSQNKAGDRADRLGRPRSHSYGTMTADGLRALIRLGLPADHPRVIAARRWLERHFTPRANPGSFEPDREAIRNATYYYWTWAAAHALQSVGVHEVEPTGSPAKIRWAPALATELLRRQLPDGSWSNTEYTDAKEDDPLVATPWAAAALAICRNEISGVPYGERGPVLVP
jgi:hypothetical protein